MHDLFRLLCQGAHRYHGVCLEPRRPLFVSYRRPANDRRSRGRSDARMHNGVEGMLALRGGTGAGAWLANSVAARRRRHNPSLRRPGEGRGHNHRRKSSGEIVEQLHQITTSCGYGSRIALAFARCPGRRGWMMPTTPPPASTRSDRPDTPAECRLPARCLRASRVWRAG
jgi:hypothetical protein